MARTIRRRFVPTVGVLPSRLRTTNHPTPHFNASCLILGIIWIVKQRRRTRSHGRFEVLSRDPGWILTRRAKWSGEKRLARGGGFPQAKASPPSVATTESVTVVPGANRRMRPGSARCFYTENMGSSYFVANPTVRLAQIDMMVCLDLVGHLRATRPAG